MRARWRTPLLAGTALLAGLTAAGGTFALWTAQTGLAGATITAGDLDIQAVGDPVWEETSADVVGAGAHLIDPQNFLVRQGDTFDVTYHFTTHLQGDNMLGQLEVDWSDAADLPPGVTGTYSVLDATGTPLGSPTALGAELRLDDTTQQLDTDDAGRTDHFTLVISLDFADLDDRFGAGSDVQLADLGTFDVELHQVRTGVGFQ